ncbi:hypothetical protein [Flagellimonas marina]|uniref:Uncharacterized protein n=1 Tax=Flagellimonas marina TaxID=1775168 RepID=A0ABV8PJI7_9FLAO
MNGTIFKFYTEYGVSIDKRLREGRTTLHGSILEAEKHASQSRSYPYPVYEGDPTSNRRAKIIGYAVPK